MEGTKPRTVSSLGMFDLLKGIGMLAIVFAHTAELYPCLLYTSPSPRDRQKSRMPSSA